MPYKYGFVDSGQSQGGGMPQSGGVDNIDAFIASQSAPQEQTQAPQSMDAIDAFIQKQGPSGPIKATPDMIPGMVAQAPKPYVEPTIGEKLLGMGEAGLTTITGATGGLLGNALGTAKGIIESMTGGTYGTQQGVKHAENEAAKMAQDFTYAPRTRAGQEYVGTIGEAASNLPPVIGIGPMAHEAVMSAKTALPTVRAAVTSPVSVGKALLGKTAPIAETVVQETRVPEQQLASMGLGKQLPEQNVLKQRQPQQPFQIPEQPAPKTVLPPTEQQANIDTMRKIGLESQRPSAITGDKFTAGQEYQHSLLNSPIGEELRSQLSKEQGAIRSFGQSIIENTGSVAASPEEAGRLIRSPLKGLSDYFDSEISKIYQKANESGKGMASVTPSGFGQLMDTASNFAGKAENSSLRRGIRAYMKEQGVVDADGKLQPISIPQAEGLRRYINSQWSPQNSGLIGKIKEALDTDVATVGGQDLFKEGRALHAERKNTLDNPKGIASLIQESGPSGINQMVSDERIGAKFLTMPTNQANHIVNTLKNVPAELQPQAQQALAELKGIIANKIYAAGDQANWNANKTTKELNALNSKMNMLFSPEEMENFKTLNRAGHILQTPTAYPGAAAQKYNLMQRGMVMAVPAAGTALGSVILGPFGAVVGSGIGNALKGKMTARVENQIARKLGEQLMNPQVRGK